MTKTDKKAVFCLHCGTNLELANMIHERKRIEEAIKRKLRLE